MGGVPDLLVIIDTNRESIALAEAHKLKIPVIAVVDSNSDPDVADFPIPGNDDAGRAISLYCDLAVKAVIDGIERSQVSSGRDIGAEAEPVMEEAAILAPAEAEETVAAEAPAEPEAPAAEAEAEPVAEAAAVEETAEAPAEEK
jgi:small subunit ribosomal protein S2